jgi:hypothetical protein
MPEFPVPETLVLLQAMKPEDVPPEHRGPALDESTGTHHYFGPGGAHIMVPGGEWLYIAHGEECRPPTEGKAGLVMKFRKAGS